MFHWGISLDLLFEGQAEGSPAGLGSFTAFLHLQLFNCDHPSRKLPPNVQPPTFQLKTSKSQTNSKSKLKLPFQPFKMKLSQILWNIIKQKTNLIWYTRSFYNVHVKKEKTVTKKRKLRKKLCLLAISAAYTPGGKWCESVDVPFELDYLMFTQ